MRAPLGLGCAFAAVTTLATLGPIVTARSPWLDYTGHTLGVFAGSLVVSFASWWVAERLLPAPRWTRRLVASVASLAAALFVFTPRSSLMVLDLFVPHQRWEALKELRLTLTDRSGHVLASGTVSLGTSSRRTEGPRDVAGLAGFESWHAGTAERIWAASEGGIRVSLSAPSCETKELPVTRDQVEGFLEGPRLQTGGHGTGVHPVSRHYRISVEVELDCELPGHEPPKRDS